MRISKLDGWVRAREGLSALGRREIEALQLARLNALLEREKNRGGFYANLPGSLSALSELAELPFTTEADLAERGGGMLLVSQSRVQRVLTMETSGTTGAAKRVFYTPEDCAATVSFFAAGLSELVFPGSRTLICMPFSGPFGLGELIAEAIASLGALPLKIGVGRSYGELRAALERERPDTFVGMAAPLLALLKFCGAGPLKRALVSGDACPPGVLGAIEARLGSRLFPHYGSREMVLGGAVTCPAHAGMHLRENHVIAEIVDGVGNVLPPGEEGELVITTVGMEAMPLVRYRTGDRTRILPGPCPCGSALLRLDAVTREGEAAAMAALDEALLTLDGVADFRAARREGALRIEALTLGPPEEARILKAARRTLPGATVSLSARPCGEGDRPLYPGKRTLAGG